MTAAPKKKLTVAEYLAIEEKAEVKSEFFNGEMFAIAGASRHHNQVGSNFSMYLGSRLLESSCFVYGSDQRVLVERTGLFTYPDVSIVCGPRRFAADDPHALVNPRVIVEVLSPSTERHDRTTKLRQYSQIPTLQEYVLVAQDRPEVVHLSRRDGFWAVEVLFEMDETLAFTSVPAKIALTEIYREVEFPPPEPPR